MTCPAQAIVPEDLHPSVWRASQLARSVTRCIDSGYLPLSTQLPGGGWPTGALTELLLPHNNTAVVRLLAPALAKVANRRIVLLQPPHEPQVLALANLGIPPDRLVWLRSKSTADALWAACQVIGANLGALLYWAPHIRTESLRRLQLAASTSDSALFVMRPIATAQDASPAPLRISVRPAIGGIELEFLKRRGPRSQPLFLPLAPASTVRPSVPTRVPERVEIAYQIQRSEPARHTELDPMMV